MFRYGSYLYNHSKSNTNFNLVSESDLVWWGSNLHKFIYKFGRWRKLYVFIEFTGFSSRYSYGLCHECKWTSACINNQ